MFTEFMEQRGPGHTAGGKNFYIKGYGDYKKEIAQAIKDLDYFNDPEAYDKEQELRAGKADITVLVLNASGEEGAAGEAAEDIEALGFEHVTVDNATYHQKGNRVSYHHEEHRAEVDEVAALFDSLPPYDPYCYEDAWTGGWSMDYDILVMLGEPGAIYPVPA